VTVAAPERSPTSTRALAFALIAVQLVFRARVTFGSWYNDDDYTFISRVFEHGPTASALLDGYSGHFMPGGFLVTWLLQRTWPFEYAGPATVIVGMQLVADLGMLRLLVRLFGERRGILPLLALFLFTSFTIPQAVWWAIAINQLPYLIAMTWGLAAFVGYLRSPRWTSAAQAAGWVVLGMLFYEKSALIPVAMAFLTLAYFTTGGLRERVVQSWRRYGAAWILLAAVGIGYVVAYVTWARSFGATQTLGPSLAPTMENLVLHCWLVGIFGGPVSWTRTGGTPLSFSDPAGLLVLLAAACLVLLLREIVRTRTHGLRGMLLPAVFLVLDGLLVTGGRASLAGPAFGLDYRYLGEMSLVTAVGLGCALMPIPRSRVQVELQRPSTFLDATPRILAASLVCIALALSSTSSYADNWDNGLIGARYMKALVHDTDHVTPATPVVDEPLPSFVMWPLTFPANLVDRVLRPAPPGLRFATAATDTILIPGPDGHLRQLEIGPGRHAPPSANTRCAHRVGHDMRRIRLDGPVEFGGWWVKIGYIASADSAIRVSAGGLTQETSVTHGLHYLYFQAGTRTFDSIRLGDLVGEATLCTNDITVGRPVPAGAS
jgi:hypothetical protein